ncbi:phosphoribosyltransferase family protein [Anaerolineales bacterium HSG6]|nr:phosphoribosyltransferase family protein [Anaerolineales bacterium HSG6]
MTSYLQYVNTDTTGPRYDVTPLFANHAAFSTLVQELAKPFETDEIDYVSGIDALGFILGTALALHFQVGFIAIRKGGKLPVKTEQISFVDYTGQQKSLELQPEAIPTGARVLLVDEWIETGAQVSAAIALIEAQAGVVAGIATLNIDDNENTRQIQKSYRCGTVWPED